MPEPSELVVNLLKEGEGSTVRQLVAIPDLFNGVLKHRALSVHFTPPFLILNDMGQEPFHLHLALDPPPGMAMERRCEHCLSILVT